MATLEQFETTLDQVNERLEKMLSYWIEELTREEELGTQFSFKEIEEQFVKIIDLFKRVKEVNLQEVPYSLLNQFNAQINNAITYFDKAKNFDPTQNNAANARQTIINNIRDKYDAYYTHSVPILSIGLLNSNDLSVERSKMNQLIAELDEQKKTAKEESDKKLKELNDILDSAKSAATQIGVSKHSTLFKAESELHETESKKWLKYTTWIIIAIIVSAIGMAFLGLYFKENTEIVQFTITKIVILTALFYGLSLTNRNYKAHKHNAIMNKHRQNALSTFETFSSAASADDVTKNAVLLETTHSIFSNQQTGYLKSDPENNSNSKIVEIIKSVTKTE
ncbi:hypothetical protein U8527_15945 [Kordia algicida OT-1]|uniref:Uncharacterized protein n=1 Tax=Kordia algicida OT-1 TaxID=391587 RepID=A9E437_9FLAO|nr:hypothetical protein [Kordia algicida]EDP95313.1 hypothetical protein KAOT1_09581 [Kordia algicida OT-1]